MTGPRITKPEDLMGGDRLGYFRFVCPEEGGYLCNEVCGLAFVRLHWQTVNWLLTICEVRHEIQDTTEIDAATQRSTQPYFDKVGGI